MDNYVSVNTNEIEDQATIVETLCLENTRILDKVSDRKSDDSGFMNVDDIDWDQI